MIADIVESLTREHLTVVACAGHGKSEAVKTLISEVKRARPSDIVKIFDPSVSWYSAAPKGFRRQSITEQSMVRANFENGDDVVYEIGSLSWALRRLFIGLVIKQDFEVRYTMAKMYGLESVGNLPRILYVVEESDAVFSSSSLKRQDGIGQALNDFCTMGRNLGLRGVFICTRSAGSLATDIRERSHILAGGITSDSDMRVLNRRSKGLGRRAMGLPRFTWIHMGRAESEPFGIPLSETEQPIDYVSTRVRAPAPVTAPSNVQPMGTMGKVALAGVVLTILALLLGAV